VSRMDISNRHLLAVDGLQEKPLHTAQRIRIIVAESWARSQAGQLLVSCLVNLLARQVGLVSHIEVVAAETELLIPLPIGTTAGKFPGSLKGIAQWAVKESVSFSDTNSGFAVDFTVLVGAAAETATGIVLFAIGNGWKAWVGDPGRGPVGIAPDKSNPLGPFLAATLVAGEIFKRTRGILRGRFLTANGYSLWSGATSPDWEALEDGPELTGAALPPIHIVGAGAVGNGLVYILVNSCLRDGYFVLLDDDRYDGTSLNRCFMAGWEDIDEPKVDALFARLKLAGLDAYAFPGTIKQYLMADRSEVRKDAARQADDLSFDVVISCVDRGISRQDVQGLAPALLLGGSTLGLAARANLYPHRPGAACLSCFNPAETDGEKIRAFEKKLRAMGADERSGFLLEYNIDAKAVEKYLSGAVCGTLGETAVREFATRGAPEFSAGFVSLGAALLLASKLFLQLEKPRSGPRRGDMTALNFQNGGYLDSYLAPDEFCEWGCQQRRLRKAG
jgi:molybdopterin/thiamine biosynthesis adenylyltransferase